MTVRLSPPLAAVIVIVYVPTFVLRGVRMVRIEVPESLLSETLVELMLNLGPVGVQSADRDTVPVKPLMLFRLIVTAPVEPRVRLSEPMLVLRLKSWKCTVTMAMWEIEPLVAVMESV